MILLVGFLVNLSPNLHAVIKKNKLQPVCIYFIAFINSVSVAQQDPKGVASFFVT
jgi:hypothetical protein